MRFIGCKALLLDNIKSVIDENAPDAKSFCDIFSGTATVARYFKQWYEVTSNDLLYFSYVLQRGTVAVDCLPTYEILQENTGISDPVAYFNGLSLEQMEAIVNLHLLTAAGTYYIGQQMACQRRCGEARIRKIRNASRKGGLR